MANQKSSQIYFLLLGFEFLPFNLFMLCNKIGKGRYNLWKAKESLVFIEGKIGSTVEGWEGLFSWKQDGQQEHTLNQIYKPTTEIYRKSQSLTNDSKQIITMIIIID